MHIAPLTIHQRIVCLKKLAMGCACVLALGLLGVCLLVAPWLKVVHHTLHVPHIAVGTSQGSGQATALHDDWAYFTAVQRAAQPERLEVDSLFGTHDANDCLLFDQLLTGQGVPAVLQWPVGFPGMVALAGWQLDLIVAAAPGHFDARAPPLAV